MNRWLIVVSVLAFFVACDREVGNLGPHPIEPGSAGPGLAISGAESKFGKPDTSQDTEQPSEVVAGDTAATETATGDTGECSGSEEYCDCMDTYDDEAFCECNTGDDHSAEDDIFCECCYFVYEPNSPYYQDYAYYLDSCESLGIFEADCP